MSMATDYSLRDVLISNSRARAETDLRRFHHARHTGALVIAAGLLLTWMFLPRRTRFVATALLAGAGAFVARDWLSQNVASFLSDVERFEPEYFGEAIPVLDDSLVDLQSRQSFPASDAPATF